MKKYFSLLLLCFTPGLYVHAGDIETEKYVSAISKVKAYAEENKMKLGVDQTRKCFYCIKSWDTKTVQPTLTEQIMPLLSGINAFSDELGNKFIEREADVLVSEHEKIQLYKKCNVIQSSSTFSTGEIVFPSSLRTFGDFVSEACLENITVNYKGFEIIRYCDGKLSMVLLPELQTFEDYLALFSQNGLPIQVVYSAKS